MMNKTVAMRSDSDTVGCQVQKTGIFKKKLTFTINTQPVFCLKMYIISFQPKNFK